MCATCAFLGLGFAHFRASTPQCVHPDLVRVGNPDGPAREIQVVLNWTAVLGNPPGTQVD